MAKSKARFLAELLSSDGKVIKTKSQASTIVVGDLPTIPNSKLENSSVTIAGEGLSLGASLTLDTGDVTEHTNYKYYTDGRVDARITNAGSGNWNTAYGWGNHASASYVTSSGNTIIGTDTDLSFTGANVLASIALTDGVITAYANRVLTLANLGYTGETNATADQSAAEIRTAVEAATNSNVFTDADHSKLNAVEASATADQSAAEIRTAVEAASDSNVFTDADHSKLNAIEASATADQSAAEIRAAVEAASDSNVFTDADHTKLGGIAASANNYVLPSGIATETYVGNQITTLIGGAPSTLNDLNELAAAINDDANYNSTLTTALATKLPLAGGVLTGNLSITVGNEAPAGANSSATGLLMRGNYNSNTWAHKFHKYDHSGGVPFYLSETVGSGSWAAVQRWGTYTGDSYKSRIFGSLKVDGVITASTGDSSNWNTAYGWGNHASAGYTTAQTAAEILTAIKTVDGSGSGLDADLLDGIQGASFLRSDADDTATGQYTFSKVNDHAIRVGTIRGTVVGSRSGEYIQMYNRVHIGSPAGWGTRDAPTYGLSTYGGVDLATDTGGVTISGSTAWHAGNDGSGSGLDADLLDGQHGSYYTNVAETLSATNTVTVTGLKYFKTAGTMTSPLIGTSPSLQAYSSGGNYAAYMAFHRSGHYAINWGLDTSNNMVLGGWSAGANAKMTITTGTGLISSAGQGNLWGASNDGAGSGLDADLLDGQQGSYWGSGGGNADTNTNFPQTGQTWTLASGYSVAQGDWGLRNTTPSGWIQFGPANTSHAHIYTNLSNFYFNVNTMYQNGNLIWAANNDGSGSGLDADLLDGINSTYFNRGTNVYGIMHGTSGGDLNTLFTGASTNRAGFFDIWSASNLPPGTSHVQGLQTRHNTGSHYGWQLAGQYNQAQWYFRQVSNGTFGSWNKIWHSNNDGSGSGLDADLLDGQQGSYYYSPANPSPDTNTTYSVGDGGLTQKNFTTTLKSKLDGIAAGANATNHVNPTFSDVYVSSWLRNNASGSGLYNTATGQHWYSDDDDYWNIAGGSAANGIRFRDEHAGTIRGYVYADNGNNIGLLDEAGAWALRVVSGNYTTSVGSFRSDYFYDIADTAYYLNPNSDSRLSQLRLASHLSVGGLSDASPSNLSTSARITFGSLSADALSNYSIGTTLENYGGNYNKLDLAFHTGIRLGAHPNYGGVRFYTDQSMGTEIFAVGKSGNFVQAANSMRAPIFYDSGNTGYYFDGASSSTSVRINGDVLCDGQYGKGMVGVYTSTVLQHVWAMGAAYRLAANGSTAGNMYGMAWSHPNAGTKGGANNLSDHGLLIINNGQFKAAISSRAVFTNDVRGTLFYDYNNTGYYCDPQSTSNLSTVQVAGVLHANGGITVDGAAIFNGSDTWFRSHGATGWYSASYGGGMYMSDSTYVRVYNGKAFQVDSASGIRSSGNITAYYSDERLKTKTGKIENALEKVQSLSGFTYVENELARSLGYENENEQVALSAQDVQKVMPQAVSLAPCDMEVGEFDGVVTSKSGENYLTVDYARLIPLLVESIKELTDKVEMLEKQLK